MFVSGPPLDLPFNPLKRAEQVEDLVMQRLKRRYYRFRPARYYGGIATADMVGCCLLCAYCWNYHRNLNPFEASGRYCDAHTVAKTLLNIARKKGLNRVRLSGAEPILGQGSFRHVCCVLEEISQGDPRMEFVLETNGLLIGQHPEFAEELAKFHRVQVRISLKGWDEDSFERVSGGEKEFFDLPLKGLKSLLNAGVNSWPAISYEVFGPEGIESISKRLREFSIMSEELEVEYLEAYPFVINNLRKRFIELRVIPSRIY